MSHCDAHGAYAIVERLYAEPVHGEQERGVGADQNLVIAPFRRPAR